MKIIPAITVSRALGLTALLMVGVVMADPGADLREAALAGDVARVKQLIAQGADVNAASDGGETPLIRAVRGKSLEAVKLLVDAGADPNAKTSDGRTALHFAADKLAYPIVQYLVYRGADINAADKLRSTALDYAERKKEAGLGMHKLLRNLARQDDIGIVVQLDELHVSADIVKKSIAESFIRRGWTIIRNEDNVVVSTLEKGNREFRVKVYIGSEFLLLTYVRGYGAHALDVIRKLARSIERSIGRNSRR